MNSASDAAHPLIQYLEGLVRPGHEDRGALAALRRGLGKKPGESPEMYPHVMWVNPKPWAEESYFLVASLFGLWHQGGRGSSRGPVPANFGASFRGVNQQSVSESIERRFVALLNAHRSDLPDHLRHAVNLMRSADQQVPINWNQLLRDIQAWDFPSRQVQRRWARSFWGMPVQTPDGTETES
jgi:CRISPR system Cascade subunit CasB